MGSEFRMVHRIEFAQTDMAGIMHFSNFFRLMEETEHAFFRSLGLSIMHREGDRVIGWPRVHASCDYRRPLRFEDEVEVHLRVREKKEKALTYDFIFHRVADPPEEAAIGKLTVVCVEVNKAAGTMKSIAIPEFIASRIHAAVE